MTRRRMLAWMALAALLPPFAGCGRKGALEPPPAKEEKEPKKPSGS